MKKQKLKIGLIVATLAITAACATKTPQKIAVDTLADVGQTGNSAYDGYVQLVLTGQLKTNDFPKVTQAYKTFQASFGAAVSAAHFATNATLANPELVDVLNQLENAVLTAEGKR